MYIKHCDVTIKVYTSISINQTSLQPHLMEYNVADLILYVLQS